MDQPMCLRCARPKHGNTTPPALQATVLLQKDTLTSGQKSLTKNHSKITHQRSKINHQLQVTINYHVCR